MRVGVTILNNSENIFMEMGDRKWELEREIENIKYLQKIPYIISTQFLYSSISLSKYLTPSVRIR